MRQEARTELAFRYHRRTATTRCHRKGSSQVAQMMIAGASPPRHGSGAAGARYRRDLRSGRSRAA